MPGGPASWDGWVQGRVECGWRCGAIWRDDSRGGRGGERTAGVDDLAIAIDIHGPLNVVDVDPLESLAVDKVSDAVVLGAIFLSHVEAGEVGFGETAGEGGRPRVVVRMRAPAPDWAGSDVPWDERYAAAGAGGFGRRAISR